MKLSSKNLNLSLPLCILFIKDGCIKIYVKNLGSFILHLPFLNEFIHPHSFLFSILASAMIRTNYQISMFTTLIKIEYVRNVLLAVKNISCHLIRNFLLTDDQSSRTIMLILLLTLYYHLITPIRNMCIRNVLYHIVLITSSFQKYSYVLILN